MDTVNDTVNIANIESNSFSAEQLAYIAEEKERADRWNHPDAVAARQAEQDAEKAKDEAERKAKRKEARAARKARNRGDDGRYQKPTALEQFHIKMMAAYYNDSLPTWVDTRAAVRVDVVHLVDCTFTMSRECEPVSLDSIEIITNAICAKYGISLALA
jgi:hypothetical protein